MQKYIVEVNGYGTITWENEAGQYHRLDGPAIEYAFGTKIWLQNGKYHRTDGPAIEGADGSSAWYQNGKLHRLDGPAAEYADGTKEWYIDGVQYTEQEFLAKTRTKEMSVVDIEKLLGYSIKIIK